MMRRIFEPHAYSDTGRAGCYWDTTVPPRDWPTATGALRADVAIIGAGFAGLNAALELAASGAQVVVVDAGWPGFGASGRNGGFCCWGGAKAEDAQLKRRFGAKDVALWHASQRAAIDLVEGRIAALDLDVDRHSEGEVQLAHTPSALRRLAASGAQMMSKDDLVAAGMAGPAFLGGGTAPEGFALNPRKYVEGLAQAALDAGVSVFGQSPVGGMARHGNGWRLCLPSGTLDAPQVLIATNGYSSDDIPDWLRARYLPAQSSVMVTRPISDTEQAAQGWTSGQMAYDTRTLLHYFRKLPDGRFLFGMRGGVRSTPAADTAIYAQLRRDFDRMFPAWTGVAATHMWSGLVCLMPGLVPFVGPLPGMPGVFGALGWHGNGVAMGSFGGQQVARMMLDDQDPPALPTFMTKPPGRFPLGRMRRVLLRAAYLKYGVTDQF